MALLHSSLKQSLTSLTYEANHEIEMFFSHAATDIFLLTTFDVIGITIASSFVVFFSLGALVVTCCCCCVMKRRSKNTPHPPDNGTLAYEMSGMDEKMFTM